MRSTSWWRSSSSRKSWTRRGRSRKQRRRHKSKNNKTFKWIRVSMATRSKIKTKSRSMVQSATKTNNKTKFRMVTRMRTKMPRSRAKMKSSHCISGMASVPGTWHMLLMVVCFVHSLLSPHLLKWRSRLQRNKIKERFQMRLLIYSILEKMESHMIEHKIKNLNHKYRYLCQISICILWTTGCLWC